MRERRGRVAPEMTPEEASLSFRAGWFASAADEALGCAHFGRKVQENRWNLTEALLNDLREEAISMGVSAEQVTIPDTVVEFLRDPDVVRTLIQYQKACDMARGSRDEDLS